MRHQPNDLTHVLHRPVEVAVDLGPSRPDDPLSLPERRGSARMDSVSTSMVMTRWSSSSREVEVHSAESFILSI